MSVQLCTEYETWKYTQAANIAPQYTSSRGYTHY